MIMRAIHFITLVFSFTSAFAEEGLKTKFYDSRDTNSESLIHSKQWITTRNGDVILKKMERSLARDGSSISLDQVIVVDGQSAVVITFTGERRMTSFKPDANSMVSFIDDDNDGIPEQIQVFDAKASKLREMFVLDKTWRITPVSDDELNQKIELLEKSKAALKGL